MNILRRPKFWVRLVSVAALLGAGWLLLVPRTAAYFVDDEGHPYDMSVLYSWDTSDQAMVLPGGLFEDDDSGGQDGLVSMVRLDCGTAFTAGENEDWRPGDGEEACSEVETPRRFFGVCLILLGSSGLWAAPRLSHLRSRMPWATRGSEGDEGRHLSGGPGLPGSPNVSPAHPEQEPDQG
ncbi:hypothetical protein [Streptomyces sp. TRM70350]|uniref:hypothetical protein n=1 Tax=Streptomyces sp. TRM70350 TaxID=2856165 RepID=UPI001C484119|nr:hypothetical protein [Streptomyces sp. TRM70350]MBV7695995.1 hypothetical protein [Streptomyces sp. TRM70350]